MEILTFLMLEREPEPPLLGRQHGGVIVGDELPISSEVGFYVELALAPVETTLETVRVELWLTSIGGESEGTPESWELEIRDVPIAPAQRRAYVQVPVGVDLEFREPGEYVVAAFAILPGHEPMVAWRDLLVELSAEDIADFQ
jgi:hypothetical protein